MLTELRYALRRLRLHPLWTATAVGTLALGIGANATIFNLVDRLLLAPPAHVVNPSRVARLGLNMSDGQGSRFTAATTSFPVFADLRRNARSFAGLAAVSTDDAAFGTGTDARSVSVGRVTGAYFGLLGPSPVVGRFFGAAEDGEPAGERVAVLSYALWRREFASSPAALGRDVTLDGATYRVIGVAPRDFTGDDVTAVDLWVPFNAMIPAAWREERHMRLVEMVARIKDGVSYAAAQDEASLALRRSMTGQFDADSTARVELTSVLPGLAGNPNAPIQGKVALWVAAMSVVVFLIAIVNVINLLLLRSAGRARETSVRLAIGASPGQLARAPLVESLLLAALGGVAALCVAAWGSEVIRGTLLPTLAASDTLISFRLLGLTLAATLVAGVASGVVPAFRAAGAAPLDGLKLGGGVVGRSHGRAPTVLLVAQGSLCMVLLVAAALFVLSLHRVRNQDFGFKSANLYLTELKFSRSVSGAEHDAIYRQAEEQIARMPGVQFASVAQSVPFLGHNVPPVAVPDRPAFPDETQQPPFMTATTPTFFNTMGMTIRQGRNFTEQDREGSPLVVIINQAMADGLWPGQSPLGRCIQAGFMPGEMPTSIHGAPGLPCREVVGVVNNARPRSIREEAGQARMMYYVPFGQLPMPAFAAGGPRIWHLLVRTNGADGMAERVQRMLQSFSAGVNLATVQPLSEILEGQMRPWLMGATMFSLFGLLALGLAAVGLYGVRAYSVAQRGREIGIRMALGAVMPDVIRLILGEGLRITGWAIVLGGATGLALSRFIDPLLFQTAANDLKVYGGVAAMLVVVTLAASAVPAWRAARVDPNVALREE